MVSVPSRELNNENFLTRAASSPTTTMTTTTTAAAIRSSQKGKSRRSKRLSCPCNGNFVTPAQFHRHECPCHPAAMIMCGIEDCPKWFTEKRNVAAHQKRVHGVVTKRKRKRNRSSKKPLSNAPTPCPDCDEMCSTRWNMKRHRAEKHGTVSTEKTQRVFQCSKCVFSNRRRYRVVDHFNCMHTDNPVVYTCKQCKFDTHSRASLNNHRAAHPARLKHRALASRAPRGLPGGDRE